MSKQASMAQVAIKEAWWSKEKETELLRLREDLESAENTLERTLQAKKKKESEISELKIKNEKLLKDYEEMANKADTVTDEKVSIEQQLDTALHELETTKRLNNQFQWEKQLITDHYNSQIKNKEKEIQTMDEEIIRMQSEIQMKDKTIKKLQRQQEDKRTAKQNDKRQTRSYNVRLIGQNITRVLQYDEVKNAATDMKNVINVFLNKLKDVKRGFCCTQLEDYIKNMHVHIRLLNKEFCTPFEEEGESAAKIGKLNEKLKEMEKQIRTIQDDLKTERDRAAEHNERFKDELQREKQLITEDYSSQLQRKDHEIQHKALEIQSLKDQIQRENQRIIDHYSIQLQRKDEETKNKTVEIQSLRENIQKFQKEMDAYVRHKESEVESMKNEILQKDNTVKQLIRQREEERTAKEEERHQKDEALTRLSAIVGERRRSNNPGITDLSDSNRPMKIAEKITEMYDNDWTDAMEALEDLEIEDNHCVEILLHFLTDAYEECEIIASELNSHLVKAVAETVYENCCKEPNTSDKSERNLPSELTKPILDLRKMLTYECVSELQKKIPEILKEKRKLTDEHMKACEQFIADCIKYAWMMHVHDPPVYIDWKFTKGSKIDTSVLRSYTKFGDHVDFVVWPVLYLHQGGPVLNKGVVQPLQ